MPRAYHVKHHYLDHDADRQYLAPPVLNQWYTIFDAHDVRLIWCRVIQANDEMANKNIQVRWTIDGTVYFITIDAINGTAYWVYRDFNISAAGVVGLTSDTNIRNAAYYVDKRGIDFKVEIRITSALGTNQVLQGNCVRETLERT